MTWRRGLISIPQTSKSDYKRQRFIKSKEKILTFLIHMDQLLGGWLVE